MSDTIKEFLVALGFRIDDASWKKFDKGIKAATADTAALGRTAVKSAAAIGLAVEQISKEYESLYYLSQRSASTVSNLKAYDYSMRQIGLSSETSQAQVESFTTALRLNPGVRGLLGAFGVGGSVDPKNQIFEITKSLKARFGEGGYFVAARFAQQFGIEEKAFRGMWQNLDRLKAADEDYQRRLRASGVNTEKVAESSTEFQNVLRGLEAEIGLVGDQTVQRWLPAAISIVQWLDTQAQWMVVLGRRTEGYSSSILTVVTALGALKVAASVLPRWLGGGLLAGASGIGGAIGGAALGLGSLAYSLYPQEAGTGSAPGPTNQRPATQAELMAEVNRRAGLRDNPNPGAKPAPLSETHAGHGALGEELVTITTSGGRRVTVSREAAPSILGFLNDLESGGAPLRSVGGYNPRKIAGTDTWSEHAHGSAVDIDQRARNIVSMEFEKWARDNPEVLQAALRRNNMIDGGTWKSPDFGHFEWNRTPLAPGGAQGASVTIHQDTRINVQGGGDPRATGEQVLNGQARVNADIVRNTKSAVQ